jgi:hypothetical protein
MNGNFISNLSHVLLNYLKITIYILFIIILVGCSNTPDTTQQKFVTFIYDLNNKEDSSTFVEWKEKSSIKMNEISIREKLYMLDSMSLGLTFYQDDDFIAYGYCDGEFGGNLIFVEKENPQYVYYMNCACAVMIEKRENGYYITESLSHSFGFGRVQYISSPHILVKIRRDSLSGNWKGIRFPEMSDMEIFEFLRSQGKLVIDSTGIIINLFYNFNNKDYIIYSDSKNTYLGIVGHRNVTTIDTLLDFPTNAIDNLPNNMVSGYWHNHFADIFESDNGKKLSRTTKSGDIYVRNDTIVIGYRYNKTVKRIDDNRKKSFKN